jgi:hypothetical protein
MQSFIYTYRICYRGIGQKSEMSDEAKGGNWQRAVQIKQ